MELELNIKLGYSFVHEWCQVFAEASGFYIYLPYIWINNFMSVLKASEKFIQKLIQKLAQDLNYRNDLRLGLPE